MARSAITSSALPTALLTQLTSTQTGQSRMESTSLANPSSLAIPSTQNTAPVHCFRCLYTYDLRRKAKRWQDGAVRFHTFNKRIMVYDISRNFIGDTHWRDGGVIEDGDELELDKGVLIQVGEKTESVDQDLTSIFEKRGRNHTKLAENHDVSSVVPDLPLAGHPALSSPFQLRPKSLNAILGTPSGSLGRAALLLKSPCELRLQNEHDMGMQRGAKRRRIECASRIVLPSITTQDPTTTSGPSNTKRDAESEMVKAANEKDLLRQSSSSAARTRKFQLATTTATPAAPQTSMDRITKEYVGNETGRPVPCPKPAHPLNPKVLEKPPGRDISNGVETPQDLQEHDAPPMRQLQIMSRKPRKKLIYQDILPSIVPTNLLPQEPGKQNTSVKSSRKGSKIADSQAEFHRAQRERLESRLKRNSRRENNFPRQEDVLNSITISDDEAFIPPPALYRATTTENYPGIPQSEPSLPREDELQPNTLPRRGRGTLSSPAAVSKPTTTSSTSYLELAQMDQILLPSKNLPPEASNLPPTEPPKPPTSASLPSTSKHPHKPPAAETASHESPNPTPFTPFPEPPPDLYPPPSKPHKRSPMRKTVSEPLGGISTCGENRAAPDQVPDPWSREAWDLFGYGRPTKGRGVD